MLKYKTKFSIGELADFRKSDRREDLQREKIQGYPLYGPNLLVKHIESFDIEQKSIGFVKWGASAGKIIKLPEKSSVVWTMGYLIPRTNLVDTDYLYYLLSNFNFTPFIAKSTVQNLYFEEFKDQNLFVHEMKDQEKIGAFLSAIDRLIEKNTYYISVIEKTKKHYQDLYLNKKLFHFESEGKNIYSFEKINLGQISKKILAGATPSTLNSDYWTNGTIPWMSSGEINNKVIFDTEKKITFQALENSSTKIIPINSILIALAGQGTTRGKVAINKIELTTNQSLASIVPNEKVYFLYLYYFLENKYEELRNISSGDGTRGGLNLKILSDFTIDLPSLIHQKKIATFLSAIDKLLALQKESTKNFDLIKKAYLKKLFAN